MDGWTNGHMDGHREGWTDESMDGQTDGQMEGWTDGRTDGRVDRNTGSQTDKHLDGRKDRQTANWRTGRKHTDRQTHRQTDTHRQPNRQSHYEFNFNEVDDDVPTFSSILQKYLSSSASDLFSVSLNFFSSSLTKRLIKFECLYHFSSLWPTLYKVFIINLQS